jgi:hypothetical protein
VFCLLSRVLIQSFTVLCNSRVLHPMQIWALNVFKSGRTSINNCLDDGNLQEHEARAYLGLVRDTLSVRVPCDSPLHSGTPYL